MKSLERQVGGTHYMKMAMQPNEFAMANGWDAAAYATLKYLGRHDSKGGLEDVKKSFHYVDIRRDLLPKAVSETGYTVQNGRLFAPLGTLAVYNSPVIPMAHYVQLNQFGNLESQALFTLERWVMDWNREDPFLPEKLQSEIALIAQQKYGEKID